MTTVITNVTELQAIKDTLAGDYELGNDIDASATSTWNAGAGFEPIGTTNATRFTGTLDGKGYKITSLFINRPALQGVGLFGFTSGTIENVGITSCDITGYWGCGALAGWQSTGGTISNCYSTGSVTSADFDVGGLVGYNGAAITECYSTVTVIGGPITGGLVGYNYSGGAISKSYATGDVSGEADTDDWIGGLVGENSSTATLTDCYARGAVTGDRYVGGLAGSNEYAGVIDNCYSTGVVTGNTDVGGLVGYTDGTSTVTNSFWDTETSGQAASDGGTGKTTAQMKTNSTFTDAGWDLSDIWWRRHLCNNGYPCLRGVTPSCYLGVGAVVAGLGGTIRHYWEPGKYRLEIGLGGYGRGFTILSFAHSEAAEAESQPDFSPPAPARATGVDVCVMAMEAWNAVIRAKAEGRYSEVSQLERIWQPLHAACSLQTKPNPSGVRYSANIEELHRARSPLGDWQPGQTTQAISRLARSPIHQAMVSDVAFTADDHNSISWAAGYIKLSTGAIITIDSGSLDLTATHYIYYTMGDSSLNNSTTYSDALGYKNVLIAIATAVASGGKAKIIVLFGDIQGYIQIGDGVGRVAALVVAANDTTALGKSQADYVCNGTNDHVEIQAAIDALPATGGEVFLLEGTYYIEASLVLDSYQTLRGCGVNTVLTTTTTDLDIITATGGDGTEKTGILIADLCIDGDAGGDASGFLIYWIYVDYSKISNVICRDAVGYYGIYFDHCDFNEIVNSIFLNNDIGMYIEYSDNNIISGNICQGSGGEGIDLYESDQNAIVGNISQGNDIGISISVNSLLNAVSSNICQGNTASGLFCGGTTATIIGNTYANNGDHGIYAIVADKSVLIGNQCKGNNLHGIYLWRSSYCSIMGNICNNQTTGDGINITGDASANSDYNNIFGNNCSDNGDDGIEIAGGTDANYNIVQSNILTGNTGTDFVDGGNGTVTHETAATGVHGVGANTIEHTGNKGATSGYASLSAGTKVVEQPASITDHLEGTPTEDLATKAPTSEWAYDHENLDTHQKVVWKDASTNVLVDSDRTVTLDWTDLDLTAATSATAKIAILELKTRADTVGTGNTSGVLVRKNGTTPDLFPILFMDKAGTTAAVESRRTAVLGLDAGQVIEYRIAIGTNWQVDTYIDVLGYIE